MSTEDLPSDAEHSEVPEESETSEESKVTTFTDDLVGPKAITILKAYREPLWGPTAGDRRYVVLVGGGGSGKALQVDEPVMTPFGPRAMKTIEEGDFVIGVDGEPTEVTHKIDVGIVPTYEFELSDGRKVRCSEGHLWNYTVDCESFITGTTQEVKNVFDLCNDPESDSKVWIPLCEPVQYRNSRPIVNPYQAGLDFADGATHRKGLGSDYLMASVEDRIDLLRGILDSAGVNHDYGIFEYETKYRAVAQDVRSLVHALGGVCSISHNDRTYRLAISNTPLKGIRTALVAIKSIKRIQDTHCQCIAVKSPENLFLTGDCIVTHNSKAISQRLAYLFLTKKDSLFLVVRGTIPALRDTAYLGDAGVIQALKEFGINPIENGWLNKTEKKLTHPSNGNVMLFKSVDDPEKIKSLNINYIWAEEATELDTAKFAQLDTRLRRENKNGINQFFISYNPIDYTNWVVQQFEASPSAFYRSQTSLTRTNFLDNPFLAIENVRAMLENGRRDYKYYCTYVLGKAGKPLGQIYPNITYGSSAAWPEELENIRPFYGIDWGFADPNVLLEIKSYKGTYYVKCLLYKSEITALQFAEIMRDELNIPMSATIYCDPARPDNIALFNQLGYGGACPAGSRNIMGGIACLKCLNITVATDTPYAKDAVRELSGYVLQPDPTDSSKVLENTPIETDNHVPDALRYSLFTDYMSQNSILLESFSGHGSGSEIRELAEQTGMPWKMMPEGGI